MAATMNDPKNGQNRAQSEVKEQSKEQKLASGPSAEKILHQERDRAAQKKQDNQVRTLVSTKENTLRDRNAPTSNRMGRMGRLAKRASRDASQAEREKSEQARREQKRVQEQRQRDEQKAEAVAFNYIGNQAAQTNIPEQSQESRSAAELGVPEELSAPGTSTKEGQLTAGDSPLTSTGSIGGLGEQQNTAHPAAGVSNEAALGMTAGTAPMERVSTDLHEQVVTLETLIGPEATLTFREKMTELWGDTGGGREYPLGCACTCSSRHGRP